MATNDRNPLFGLGDIVKLTSGGPDMTIYEVCNIFPTNAFEGSYNAQWFAGKKLELGNFPEASLELVKKKS
ncbi:YodC family protein [Shewanella sp.]|uniref:YodC family protein n=1 Tax=Shewanella sp. TaxID=50422 RepID=UPI003A88D15B